MKNPSYNVPVIMQFKGETVFRFREWTVVTPSPSCAVEATIQAVESFSGRVYWVGTPVDVEAQRTIDDWMSGVNLNDDPQALGERMMQMSQARKEIREFETFGFQGEV